MILSGCWKQHDVISIKSDGATTFETEVIITEESLSEKNVKEIALEFTSQLKSAGWKLDEEWISKKKPYKIQYTGKANIFDIKNAPDFYKIKNIDDKSFEIQFIASKTKSGKSSRRVEFKSGFFGGAKVIDDQEKQVKEISDVKSSKKYIIQL